jgi:hypothetical protein
VESGVGQMAADLPPGKLEESPGFAGHDGR